MAFAARTVAAFLVLGLAVVGFTTAFAQTGPYSQIVITTQVASGSATPSSAIPVTITGAGPSLSNTPGPSGNLTFNSGFNTNSHIVTLIPSQYEVRASNTSGYVYNYSSGCSGSVFANEVKNCTITAYQGGLGNLTVYTYVTNNNGGTRTPSEFTMQVLGGNALPATFQGSSTGVIVNVDANASYSVDGISYSGYSKTLSSGCSGVFTAGQSRTCTVTYDDQGSVLGATSNHLVCSPARQSTRIGDTVTFFADGGSGSYNWATADRTFLNAGRTLNVNLMTTGTQIVIVTSGSQTAYCTVDVFAAGSPVVNTPPSTTGTIYIPGKGIVLGTSYPGVPNTGLGYNEFALALTLALSFGGAFLILPYARRTLTSIWS